MIHVWLGESGQSEAAKRAYEDVKRKFAPTLDSYALEIREFVTAGASYRIYVGPVDSVEKAQAICKEIKSRDSGQMCRPVIN